MASLGSSLHGPSSSPRLLLLVMLLHALLVWALLESTGRRAAEAPVAAVVGALLFAWEQAALREDSAAASRGAAESPRQSVRDAERDTGREAASPRAAGAPSREANAGREANRTPAAPALRPGRAIDWYSTGEAVARDFAARLDQPGPRPLDRRPTKPAAPKERVPRSVFADDTSRVGKTTRNADGETLYWITPNCYISLGPDSTALREVQAMREGMAFCRIPLGKREARGDLFEEMPTQRGSRYAEKYDPASTEPQPVL